MSRLQLLDRKLHDGIFAISKVKRILQAFQHRYAIVTMQSDDIRVSMTRRLLGLGICGELLFCVNKADGLTLGCGQFLAVINNGFDCHRRSSIAC